jgi:hypothetical protein
MILPQEPGEDMLTKAGELKWEPSLRTNIELLTADQCGQVRAGLETLRDCWIQRHPTVPFFTLGASNYFDIAYNPELPYYRMARELNPVLMEHFDWLYQSLAECLGQLFGIPVVYPRKLALPGFHIFLAHEAMKNPRALMHGEWFQRKDDPAVMSSPIHCDTPQYVVNWSGIDDVKLNRPISITLAVALPASGAGMYVWNLGIDETVNLPERQIFQLLQDKERAIHEYRLGQFCLHSGLFYHQLAPFQDVQPDDLRITLQGHGLIGEKSLILYW